VWPIANVHIPGYDRNEMMATHMSNHIVIGYGDILEELIATLPPPGHQDPHRGRRRQGTGEVTELES
jgi:L-fucose isomerase-like protein